MSERAESRIHEHQIVVDAFREISDKEALAWSVLDTKSETAITRAIALSANRRANARIAHVEYPPRLDLALIECGAPVAVYEAKAAYATDFQPRRIAKNDWYLGRCTDDDLVKLHGVKLKYPTLRKWAALFFVYEVGDPRRQLKYGGNPPVSMDRASTALSGVGARSWRCPAGLSRARCLMDLPAAVRDGLCWPCVLPCKPGPPVSGRPVSPARWACSS